MQFQSRPGFEVISQHGDKMQAKVSIPAEEDGMISRLCPDEACVPRYFKVRMGTGIVDAPDPTCYCPYCKRQGEPSDFFTPAQFEYVKRVFGQEAERMMQEEFGKIARSVNSSFSRNDLIQLKMEVKSSHARYTPSPDEGWVRRVLTCKKCGLEHAVYGLSMWCSDCATSTFPFHVANETQSIQKQMGDIERRRKELGLDIAQRDIDNILEDIVSFYEGFMKHLFLHRLATLKGRADADACVKKDGNVFQRLLDSLSVFKDKLGCDLSEELPEGDFRRLDALFQSRHVLTHNLGVADQRFVEKTGQHHALHRDILIREDDLSFALGAVEKLVSLSYERLHDQSKPGKE